VALDHRPLDRRHPVWSREDPAPHAKGNKSFKAGLKDEDETTPVVTTTNNDQKVS
jgi:hypothetical protein